MLFKRLLPWNPPHLSELDVATWKCKFAEKTILPNSVDAFPPFITCDRRKLRPGKLGQPTEQSLKNFIGLFKMCQPILVNNL